MGVPKYKYEHFHEKVKQVEEEVLERERQRRLEKERLKKLRNMESHVI